MQQPLMFGTSQVSQITGTSLRQLQWWHERGFVSIHIAGHRRYWDEVEVTVAWNLSRIRQRGYAKNMKAAAAAIRKWAQIAPPQPAYLLVGEDGKPVVGIGETDTLEKANRIVRLRVLLQLQAPPKLRAVAA